MKATIGRAVRMPNMILTDDNKNVMTMRCDSTLTSCHNIYRADLSIMRTRNLLLAQDRCNRSKKLSCRNTSCSVSIGISVISLSFPRRPATYLLGLSDLPTWTYTASASSLGTVLSSIYLSLDMGVVTRSCGCYLGFPWGLMNFSETTKRSGHDCRSSSFQGQGVVKYDNTVWCKSHLPVQDHQRVQWSAL